MANSANAQQVYPPFIFSQIPQDFQLYARNYNNVGLIPIVGTIQDKGWKSISIVVYRESKLYGYQKVKVQVNAQEDAFSSNTVIKSEKAEYSIFIYATKNDKDSVLVTSRKGILAGDFYVIYGDSNGNTQNVVDYYPTNKFIRTFGRYNHDIQKDYLPKDTTWSLNENYFIPRVGAWGTMLQEMIVDKYDVPVGVITGGGPGMYIDLLMDREGTGLNAGGVYNSLGYRIKKSGLINNIKGFFLWHGVYELFSKTNSVEYDAKLKKLMGYLIKDFPSVEQFIVFQSGMVRFGLDGNTGASIRESQRSLGYLFPKTKLYAVEGLEGYDGVHYTKRGYLNCANEILKIIEPIFYNKTLKSNYLSPNIQKIFFTDESRRSIKLVFEQNQNILIGNDTTVKMNGQNMNLTLKKYFFQEENFDKSIDIQRISASINAVTITSETSITAKRLSYLPPFHKDFADDYPVFMGPYIKNTLQARALSFNNVKIQDPLSKPQNLAAAATIDQIKLTWNNLQSTKNALIYIERKTEREEAFKLLKTLTINDFEYTDSGLTASTTYDYQLKVVSDSSESIYSAISLKTLVGLGKPKLTTTVLYNNKVQLTWNSVTGAERYIIQRRLKSSNQYTTIFNSANNVVKSLIDSSLTANQIYIYKITTTRAPNDLTSDSTEVATPDLLIKPELTAVAINYNAIRISWKPVLGTISYRIERKIANESYKFLATLDNKVTVWNDRDLVDNTFYSYRIKAFGDKTESLESEISSRTPAILQSPELISDKITHESIQLKWKAVQSANKYILERQLAETSSFQKIFETDMLLEFTDNKLKDKAAYTYRLKAFSDISESIFVKIEAKTTSILSNLAEEHEYLKLYPNPTRDKLTISLKEPISGNLTFIDLSGKTVLFQDIYKQKLLEINVSAFKKGIYLVLIKTNQELYSQKVIVE